MVKSCFKYFLGFFLVGLTHTSHAAIVQASVFTTKPLVFVDLNTQERKPLGSKLGIGGEVAVFIPEFPFSAGVYYDTMFKTDFGDLPVTSSGLLVGYYPFGKPIFSNNIEGQVFMRGAALAAYGTLGTGLTSFNVRGEDGAVFGAVGFNLRLALNLDYPVSENFLLGGLLSYQTTFGAQDAELIPNPVGMTGFSMGVKFSALIQ